MPQEILTELHGRRCGLAKYETGVARPGIVLNHNNTNDQTLLGHSVVKTITSAQLLALNATPQTVIAAPDSGIAVVPYRMMIYKPAGTAYGGIAAGEDLVLKYTNGSGAQCTGVIETTGFLDQTTAQTRIVGMPGATGTTAGDYAPVAGAAVVLHLLVGEITTGDQPLYVRVWYDLAPVVFTG